MTIVVVMPSFYVCVDCFSDAVILRVLIVAAMLSCCEECSEFFFLCGGSDVFL